MKELWDALGRALDARGAKLELGAGAAEPEIEAAEAEMGVALPEELRALLRVQGGQPEPTFWDAGAVHLFPAEMRLYSLAEIVSEHAAQAASHGEEGYDLLSAGDTIRRVSWHRGRVPFAGQEGTCWLYCDLVPGPRGTDGQVLYNTSEVDMALLGTGIGDFLTRYLAALEDGRLTVVRSGDVLEVRRAPDDTTDWYPVLCLAE